MTVYIVYKYEWDVDNPVRGVFSSRAQADAYIARRCTGGDVAGMYSVEEEMVDSAI